MPKPATSTQGLTSLTERDESPTEGVISNLDAIVSSPAPTPKTPRDSSPIKPPMSEMHPSKVHGTMGPPSSGLRLGFTDIKPSTNSRHVPAGAQGTPSKLGLPSSPFTFRFARQAADIKLGPEAQRMMDDIREEASKIKAELAAKRELEKKEEEEEAQMNSRKFARPKGKAGRYSAAHMAEFKKMDSIENHASAFRAQPGRFTPVTGLKRTQSRANLNDSDSARSKRPTPSTTRAKVNARENDEPAFPAKRARQLFEEDASSRRPVSRDGSSIPRPKSSGKDHQGLLRSQSSLASLMTPTKASMARTAIAKTPAGSLARSPSKPNLSGLKQSVTTNNVAAAAVPNVTSPAVTVRSPRSRFGKMKSMLRGNKPSPVKEMLTGIPLPSESFSTLASASASASPTRPEKATPSRPSATPARKLSKRVGLTPETKRIAMENSPSPVKSGLPRPTPRQVLGEVRYPTLDTVITGDSAEGSVSYPDLSAYRPLTEAVEKPKPAAAPTPGPGTFTFRSDHTINFGDVSPTGFGSSPGQSSVRHVRQSIMPTVNMPGSFPAATASTGPNKENKAPQPIFRALPHGMINKKRHRVSTDEEDAEKEAADRAAKKRKNDQVPEGDALLAPRLVGASGKKPIMSPTRLRTPGGAGTPSPRKKAMLSLSRLNMLARPKLRK